MDFEYSDRCKDLQGKLLKFMDQHIYPNETTYKQEIDRNGRETKKWTTDMDGKKFLRPRGIAIDSPATSWR